MKWPWRAHEPDHEGLARARQQLVNAQADEPRVSEIAENLHRKIRENHFGPKIAAALREEHR